MSTGEDEKAADTAADAKQQQQQNVYDVDESESNLHNVDSGGAIVSSSSRGGLLAGANVLADAAEGEIDFLKDRKPLMTFGRRIALFLSERYEWYNPYLGKTTQQADSDVDDPTSAAPIPSIAKAWAFFDHVTLSRYEIDERAEKLKKRKAI